MYGGTMTIPVVFTFCSVLSLLSEHGGRFSEVWDWRRERVWLINSTSSLPVPATTV
jgi:hypothetical protein